MIINNIHLKMLGNDECVLDGFIFQDNIPILEENYVQRMNANNGFSKKRLFRKIASIPVVHYWKAAQEGYNLDEGKDLKRFLEANPGYMTVEKLKTPRPGNIIIK